MGQLHLMQPRQRLRLGKPVKLNRLVCLLLILRAFAPLLSQVIEQDGVLILETVETDPNDPEALPQVRIIMSSRFLDQSLIGIDNYCKCW